MWENIVGILTDIWLFQMFVIPLPCLKFTFNIIENFKCEWVILACDRWG